MYYFDFIGYAVVILAGTGLLLLIEDVNAYKHAGLKKERKTAKVLGWTNLSLGALIFFATLFKKCPHRINLDNHSKFIRTNNHGVKVVAIHTWLLSNKKSG